MTLSDNGINKRLALPDDDPRHLRITPFAETSPPGAVSFGLSSAGYDVRVGRKFKVFTNARNATVSPKRVPTDAFVDFEGDVCVIPPNSFALAASVERFRIPRDVVCTCLGKSTYTRCGVIVTVTPLEPEWEGYITVEISNSTPCPAEIFANEGILQVLFHELDDFCFRSYADKKGIYQSQEGITLPRVK